MPKSVHILALTVTATQGTVDCVIERLSMKDTTTIGDDVNRSNIKYILGAKISQAENCTSLADELLTLYEKFLITVLFRRTLLECGETYGRLKSQLGKTLQSHQDCQTLLNFA